jgi:hypothetical protein
MPPPEQRIYPFHCVDFDGFSTEKVFYWRYIEIDYNNLEGKIKYKDYEISYLPAPFHAADLPIGDTDFLLN